jgi:hypothetical protein
VISETNPAQFVTNAAKVADSDEAPPNLDPCRPMPSARRVWNISRPAAMKRPSKSCRSF